MKVHFMLESALIHSASFFQGFFILLFHVILNEKAKQELVRHLKKSKKDVKVIKPRELFQCKLDLIYCLLQAYFSKSSGMSQQPIKDTTSELTTKTYNGNGKLENDRKISSNITSSTDLNSMNNLNDHHNQGENRQLSILLAIFSSFL